MTRKRSKIKSKTRSNISQKSEDEVLYCICRSSDGTRFMIACDNCEEWYHGDCINVTPKQANNIKQFFCHLCIGRNPHLEIVYKTIKENRPRLPNLRQQIKKINFSSEDENDADLSSTSTPKKSFAISKNKRIIRKRSRQSVSGSVKSVTTKKRRGRPKEKPDDYDDEATEDEIETSGFIPAMSDCPPINLDEQSDNIYLKKKSRNQISHEIFNPMSASTNSSCNKNYLHNDGDLKSCGNCDGCKTVNDCGKCDICKKYGTNINMRFKCLKRICIRDHRNKNQFFKDYATLFHEDLECGLDDHGYGSQKNTRSRNDFDISEIRQRINSNSNKELGTVGSKMRRGDHLPGGGNSIGLKRGLCNSTYFGGESFEVANGTSYRFRQQAPTSLSRNQNISQNQRKIRSQSNTVQMSSNTSSISSQLSPRQYPYADESDEDVMIPNELISPGNGQRRSLVESDKKNNSSFNQQVHSRMTKTIINNEIRKYQYGLNYPDHLYCKHHRFFNWHTSLSEDSVSPDITNCKVEQNLKFSDKESEIHSHSRLRSPSSEQQLSPGNFEVLDRSVKKAQISSTGIRLKSQIKINNSLPNNNGYDVPESVVTLYTESNQVYPIIDLNKQIIGTNISLNSSTVQMDIESNSHSSPVFKKVPMANIYHQEFYTINDEDDLEINWPKETVNV